MNELYLVQAEYMFSNYAYSFVSQIGVTDDYEYAKKLCEDCVNEDIEEGTIPGDGKWNDPYHDEYVYDDDDGTHIVIYVCTVDFKNKG